MGTNSKMVAGFSIAISALALGSCLNAPEDREAGGCTADFDCPLFGQICAGGECNNPDPCDSATPCPGGFQCMNEDDQPCTDPADSCRCEWPCSLDRPCPGGAVCDDGFCVPESGTQVFANPGGLAPLTGPSIPIPDPDPYYYEYDQFDR